MQNAVLPSSGKPYYLQKNPKELTTLLGKLFVFSFTWSIGCAFRRTEDADQDFFAQRGPNRGPRERLVDVGEEFDTFVHDLFEVEPPLGVRLPSSNRLIYAYFMDLESGNLVPWDNLVPSTSTLLERSALSKSSDSFGGGEGGAGGGGNGGQRRGSKSHRAMTEELIPTVDTIRYSFFTALFACSGSPVLVTGEISHSPPLC